MAKYTVTEYSLSAVTPNLTKKQVNELANRLSKRGKGERLVIIKNQETGELNFIKI